jgi:predicted phosphodiesterase
MRLHILSDVHLEFGDWPTTVDINAIPADITILAGDIGAGLSGLEWALSFSRPVIYVMGNHEFYGHEPMPDLWRAAREKVQNTHVRLLENESVIIDGVRFLGCTLWTDFAILGPERQERCMQSAKRSMADYGCIFMTRHGSGSWHQGDSLTPRKTLSLHHESRDFLERELSRAPDPNGIGATWERTIVVTHHAPSTLSLACRKAIVDDHAAYASDLDHLAAQADLWVHGHTHFPADYRTGPGRVVSNPRGYVGHEPVRKFDPAFVIQLSEE